MKNLIVNNRSALLVTYGCMLFEGATNCLLIATMSLLETHYSVSASSISTLITLKSMGTVLTIYFSGSISDKIGRKNIIALGGVFFVLFLVGMVTTRVFYVASVFAFIGGIAHGLMDAPAISMLIDIFGRKSGPAMSVVQVFFASGSAITSTITSIVIKNSFNWHLIYWGFSGIGIIVILIVLKATYPIKYKIKYYEMNEVEKKDEPSFMREGLILATIIFLLSSVNSVINTWLPSFAYTEKSIALADSVDLLAKMQLGNIFGAILFAYLLTKIHATVLLSINPIIAFFGLILIVFLPNIYSWSVFIVGMVMGILFSLALNIAGEMFPQSAGKATGFIGAASTSAGVFTVFMTGRLYQITGFRTLFIGAIIILCLAIVLSSWFRLDFKKLRSKKVYE